MRRMASIASPPQHVVLVMAASTFMMFMTTVGTVMRSLEAEFGWLRADISLAYTLFSIGAAGGGLVWGHLADHCDPRPIAVFGSTMMTGGLILLSLQSSVINIQLIYLLIGMFIWRPGRRR
jgi:MFS family permease